MHRTNTPVPTDSAGNAIWPQIRDYMNTAQAAEHLGVSARWLEKLRVVGGGPLYSKPLDRVIYRRSDLDDWIAQHLRKNTADTTEEVQ